MLILHHSSPLTPLNSPHHAHLSNLSIRTLYSNQLNPFTPTITYIPTHPPLTHSNCTYLKPPPHTLHLQPSPLQVLLLHFAFIPLKPTPLLTGHLVALTSLSSPPWLPPFLHNLILQKSLKSPPAGFAMLLPKNRIFVSTLNSLHLTTAANMGNDQAGPVAIRDFPPECRPLPTLQLTATPSLDRATTQLSSKNKRRLHPDTDEDNNDSSSATSNAVSGVTP
jgi:hypothetical protein